MEPDQAQPSGHHPWGMRADVDDEQRVTGRERPGRICVRTTAVARARWMSVRSTERDLAAVGAHVPAGLQAVDAEDAPGVGLRAAGLPDPTTGYRRDHRP